MIDARAQDVLAVSTHSLLEDIRALLGLAAKERSREPRASRQKAVSVRHGPTAAIEFHEAIRRGLPITVLSRLKQHTQLSDEELARTLGLSRKTLQRRMAQKDQVLSVAEGDVAYRVAKVFAFAKTLFGNSEAASGWLREPQVGLGRDMPLDLLRTNAGSRAVEDYLSRMAHSGLS